MLQYDYITVNTRPTHIYRPHGVSLKIRLKYMFTFFKKLSVPLTPCLLSESRFRGRTECGEARTGDMMAERRRERPFILSDKETSGIGVYHTFNWTSSLCPAGHWKWTTGMCQLAPGTSTSLVHSCYQPPTISVSLSFSLSLSCSHPPGLGCLHFLSPPLSLLLFLSLCFLMCIPDLLLFFPPLFVIYSTSYFAPPPIFLSLSLSISSSSPLPTFPSVFSFSL